MMVDKMVEMKVGSLADQKAVMKVVEMEALIAESMVVAWRKYPD
jgi:hypothetical protein